MRFKELGWNGFLIEMPENMRLAAEGGNINSGYLRLEMENFLAEIKWEPLDPKKAKSLTEIADFFIKSMRKSAKKKIDLKVERAESVFTPLHSAYYMAVKSEVNEHVYLWNCEESKRIVILHFVPLLTEEENMKIIEHVLKSLKCHEKEELVAWSALNMRFKIPASFLLSERKMAVGRTHLAFDERIYSSFTEKSRRFLIEYFSMANIIFEDTYKDLDRWFQEKYWKDLKKHVKNVKFQMTETRKIMRHNVIFKKGIKKSGFMWRKTTMFENLSWYCSKSNRIYSVTFSSYVNRPFFLKRKLDEDVDERRLQDFLLSFKCH